MNELIGKKIHESFGGKWFEEIVEIVCYTEILLLVKTRADDGFEMYAEFMKKNGEWDFSVYSHTISKKDALYFFDLDSKKGTIY